MCFSMKLSGIQLFSSPQTPQILSPDSQADRKPESCISTLKATRPLQAQTPRALWVDSAIADIGVK